MESGEVRSDGEDGRGGGGARRCTALTTTSDGAFEATPPKHNNQIMEDMRGKKRGFGGDDNDVARQWQ